MQQVLALLIIPNTQTFNTQIRHQHCQCCIVGPLDCSRYFGIPSRVELDTPAQSALTL